MLLHGYFLGFWKNTFDTIDKFSKFQIGPGQFFHCLGRQDIVPWESLNTTLINFDWSGKSNWYLLFSHLKLHGGEKWRWKWSCVLHRVFQKLFAMLSKDRNYTYVLILDTLRLKPLLTSLNVCIYKLMLMFDAWMAPIRRRESLA